MENGPFEDVFPIKNGDIPASYVSLPEGRYIEAENVCFFSETLPNLKAKTRQQL